MTILWNTYHFPMLTCSSDTVMEALDVCILWCTSAREMKFGTKPRKAPEGSY